MILLHCNVVFFQLPVNTSQNYFLINIKDGNNDQKDKGVYYHVQIYNLRIRVTSEFISFSNLMNTSNQ